ncbi:hypothetical protein B0A50_00342 [Salinomyces thailandicus]|uniref:Uncharacterized protein n=1 Tax=Salinomyces thailandicus TaxID=706561 RepID=A0A4U0UFL6_9PEZI|nr:hypothetical protein B0A50_00342 [Salinomyces thailandica]
MAISCDQPTNPANTTTTITTTTTNTNTSTNPSTTWRILLLPIQKTPSQTLPPSKQLRSYLHTRNTFKHSNPHPKSPLTTTASLLRPAKPSTIAPTTSSSPATLLTAFRPLRGKGHDAGIWDVVVIARVLGAAVVGFSVVCERERRSAQGGGRGAGL